MSKIYLDTCILSKLLQENIEDEQLVALDKISDNADANLVTSPKTLQEFCNTTNDKRRMALKVLFKIIGKVYAPPHTREYSPLFGDAPWGVPWGEGGTITEDLFIQLKNFFDHDDAEHIYAAKKAECDFFLTLDMRSIINRYKKNKDKIEEFLSPLEIVDPVSLAKLLQPIFI